MKRVGKREGVGNVILEEAEVPAVGPRDVLIRAEASLISRGSEIGMRYLNQNAVDHSIMGYSLAGVVEKVGEQVTEYRPGQRVAAVAPHAEYVSVSADLRLGIPYPTVTVLPDHVSFEAATFLPLASSAVMWSWIPEIRSGETVVILGQGLVGNLILQTLRLQAPDKVITVEAIPLRQELSRRFGADAVIDPFAGDPAAAVRAQNDGRGANVVIEAVGGRSGVKAFSQGVEILELDGRLMLVGLYQGEPLPLDASKIMRKRIIGGVQGTHRRKNQNRVALDLIAHGLIRAEEMITHRIPASEAPEAFHLLYNRIEETMGVVLMWN